MSKSIVQLILLASFAFGSEARSSLVLPPVDQSASRVAADESNVAAFRDVLNQPEERIDLARAKVAIDRMFDPALDEDGTLRLLDEWAEKVRARFPEDASNKAKVELLVSTLYTPGPWNDNQPFGYDYDNPLGGDDLSLSTYLATRKGQCVTMPTLVVILGQKLGLPLTLTTAPSHMMAKYGDEEIGEWTNVEATSGRFYDDGRYVDSMRIPEAAAEQGIYLRPHTPREAVALLMTAALGPAFKQRRAEFSLGMTALILEANPKDVVAMTIRADAHYKLIEEKRLSRFPSVEQMPPDALAELNSLTRENHYWYSRAEALGWKARTQEDVARYLEHFSQKKSQAEQGGQ